MRRPFGPAPDPAGEIRFDDRTQVVRATPRVERSRRMPGPEEHVIAIDDRGTVGVELTCQTCGWEQHVPSMGVANLLAAEHRATPDYADKGWAM